MKPAALLPILPMIEGIRMENEAAANPAPA